MKHQPPLRYREFIDRFPSLGEAWQLHRRAAEEVGSLDERTQAFVKLGIAIGAMREGAVHSATRKAVALGASRDDIDQVVALASSTIGMPGAVAVWTWVADVTRRKRTGRRQR